MTEMCLCYIHFWVNSWPRCCSDLSSATTAMCSESPQLISKRRKTEPKVGLKLCSHPRTHFIFLYPSLHSTPEEREMSCASLIKWLRGGGMLLLEEENGSHQPGKRGLSPLHYAQSGAWLVWVSENRQQVQMGEAGVKGCLLRHKHCIWQA